jgi:AcrR family transcriptional regulator
MNQDSESDSRLTLRARLRTATREAILDAAAELLGGDGTAQTRMEDIAAKAGVAVGTVYNHFEDRTALVSALLETRTEALLEALDAAATRRPGRTASAAGTPRDLFEADLERFVAALGTHFNSNRFLITMLVDEEGRRGIDAKAATRRRSVLGDLLQRAERLVERGIRTKVLRRDDPAIYAALLLGMVRGIAQSALAHRKTVSTESTAAIVRMFLRGAAR